MPLASALQTWQLTVKTLLALQRQIFHLSKLMYRNTFDPNTFIGGNNSRARCFPFACFQPQGCGAVVKMIQLQLRSSFFLNRAPAPEIMVFMCVAPAPEKW